MEKIHKYIHELAKASKNGKLVFFIGAGLSTLSKYPQWWELVDKYYLDLHGSRKSGDYSSDEYLKIPQIFYDVKGEDEYDRILEAVFAVDKFTNPIHDKILSMNPVHIMTTNYDELIDKACWQRGKYFSIISAEEDVAKVTSSRYLLKVHGDFRRGYKGKYVVLKESDYLNYEQQFPLISNLMKTIMATHTIVFIGYGLGDYNINLILNWVKQLQKDGYNKPFFIRTDHEPIEKNNALYYENKGLRIIDAASLISTTKDEYFKRYNTVMNILIESKDNELLVDDDDIIDYIYQKISPLFVLKSIRKLDLKHVFEYDYHFEVNGTVIRNKKKGFGYIERFFELKESGIDNLSSECRQKFKKILDFFQINGIFGMIDNTRNRSFGTTFNIENIAYHNNYDEMTRIIQTTSSSYQEDYRKAFFLACLGKWEEAYNLYTSLLLKTMDVSNWWVHYLSQVNRYRLYQSIKQTVKQLESVGLFIYRQYYRPFTDEFLERIEREMKNFDINDVFKSMPYEFQEKYQILEFLSDNEFLYDDTVKLFELTNKIHSEMSKGTSSFGSLTSDLEIQFRLNDNIRFLYENYLWSIHFKEIKQYLRNSLILQFEKAEYEQNRDIDDFGLLNGLKRARFSIDYYDFVNVTKSFSVDDVKHVERSCNIERIEFHDLDKIENYLMRIADEIFKCFSREGMNIIFYNQIIPEAKVAFYFSRYVKLSEEGLTRMLRVLLFYFPQMDADIGTRYLWTERLAVGSGLPVDAIKTIEEFLIMQANKHKNSEFYEESTNNLFSKNFGNLIHHFDNEFVSNQLSEYALSLSEKMNNQVNFMYRLSPILSDAAKNHLLVLKKIDTIDAFMDSLINGDINNISDYKDMIIRFMNDRTSKILDDRKKGIIVGYIDNYVVQFGIWYFLRELTDPRMKDYLGVEDEYDFFVNPEVFNFSKFKPSWLKNYNDELLEKIAKNKHMRINIIEILKERIKSTNDKKYFDIFIKNFL